jgi:hypothetical protein
MLIFRRYFGSEVNGIKVRTVIKIRDNPGTKTWPREQTITTNNSVTVKHQRHFAKRNNPIRLGKGANFLKGCADEYINVPFVTFKTIIVQLLYLNLK